MANFARSSKVLLDDSIEWEKSGSSGFRKTMWAMPNGRPIRVRFITDPDNMDHDHGWCVYREVNAWNGLIGGDKMPAGLKEFPVDDFDIIEPSPGEIRKVRKKDLYQQRVVPSTYDQADGRNFASASTKIITSVVYEGGDLEKDSKWNPNAGQMIILKFGKKAYEQLQAAFESKRDEDDAFTPVGPAWDILIEGTGMNIKLSLRKVKDSIPIDMPDPIDAVDFVNHLRKQAEDYIDSLDGAAPEFSYQAEEAIESEEDITDTFESNRAATPAGPIDWENVSLARIRAKLKDAGVVAGPRATRDELIALAAQHLTDAA